MFGINLSELSVIVVVALVVIGPERLPQYAEHLARFVREGRKMALGLREQVREEIGPDFDDVDWRQLDPRQYDPRRIVREALSEPMGDSTAAKAQQTPTRRPKASGGVSMSKDAAAPRDAAAAAPAEPPAPFDTEAT